MRSIEGRRKSGQEKGPSPAELRAIEVEWPSIAADLAALEVEIRSLSVGSGMSELERRRARRDGSRVLRQAVESARFGGLGGAA